MVTLDATVPQDNSLTAEESNNEIVGSDSPDILVGTSGDDKILALGGDDTIIGTTGNDLIDGGDGFDTVDYHDFGEAVTILPSGGFNNGGQTQHSGIEKTIGAIGHANTIDGSTSTGDSTSLDADLSNNRLTVQNIPNIGSINIEAENFVHVVGTAGGDRLTGSSLANNLNGGDGDDELTGADGNDTLIGGSGNDRLDGTDTLLRGAGEQDNLSGGDGSDRFVLGDRNGSFYIDEGNNDFAKITDFSFGDIIEFGREGTYSVESNGSSFNLFVQLGEEKELIANVEFSFQISNEISFDGNSFNNQIELPTDSFGLDFGESLDILL